MTARISSQSERRERCPELPGIVFGLASYAAKQWRLPAYALTMVFAVVASRLLLPWPVRALADTSNHPARLHQEGRKL